MRKTRAALLAGAVVVGVGAVVGLAAFAPSLIGQNNHELTLQLPGGGTETVVYSGTEVPKVTLRPMLVPAFRPAPSFVWAVPFLTAFDPLFADMNRDLDMLVSAPVLVPSLTDQLLEAADLFSLPPRTSY